MSGKPGEAGATPLRSKARKCRGTTGFRLEIAPDTFPICQITFFSGPQIRSLRMARGLSQDQLAAQLQVAGLLHMDRAQVAKVESQIRSIFDWELMLIADVLEVGTEELRPGKGVLKRELGDLMAGER